MCVYYYDFNNHNVSLLLHLVDPIAQLLWNKKQKKKNWKANKNNKNRQKKVLNMGINIPQKTGYNKKCVIFLLQNKFLKNWSYTISHNRKAIEVCGFVNVKF